MSHTHKKKKYHRQNYNFAYSDFHVLRQETEDKGFWTEW
jgi:hypothetical protein